MLYERLPHVKSAKEGDLTKQRAVREKLQCKPFKWFLETVAPDLLEWYPAVEHPFASGAIQSVANPAYCFDTLYSRRNSDPVGLNTCRGDPARPHASQRWKLSEWRDIRNDDFEVCIDVYDSVILWGCHGQQGNQLMRYDLVSKFYF